MSDLGTGIKIGEKVWSNNRWGEVVAVKQGSFEVYFEPENSAPSNRSSDLKRARLENLYREIDLFVAMRQAG